MMGEYRLSFAISYSFSKCDVLVHALRSVEIRSLLSSYSDSFASIQSKLQVALNAKTTIDIGQRKTYIMLILNFVEKRNSEQQKVLEIVKKYGGRQAVLQVSLSASINIAYLVLTHLRQRMIQLCGNSLIHLGKGLRPRSGPP